MDAHGIATQARGVAQQLGAHPDQRFAEIVALQFLGDVKPGADGEIGPMPQLHQPLIVGKQGIDHEVVPARNEMHRRRVPSQPVPVVELGPELVIAHGMLEPVPPEPDLVSHRQLVGFDQR